MVKEGPTPGEVVKGWEGLRCAHPVQPTLHGSRTLTRHGAPRVGVTLRVCVAGRLGIRDGDHARPIFRSSLVRLPARP